MPSAMGPLMAYGVGVVCLAVQVVSIAAGLVLAIAPRYFMGKVLGSDRLLARLIGLCIFFAVAFDLTALVVLSRAFTAVAAQGRVWE